jgi:glycosyltransferase involved in cell wall biosynthesis
MRILHIIATLKLEAGGPAEAIRHIVNNYPPLNYEGDVVTFDDPAAPFLAGLPFVVYPFGPVHTVYGFNSKLLPWLRANLDRYDGVVVHGLWQFCGFAALWVVRGKKPYAVFTHGMLDPYFKHAFPLKHLKKWIYWLLGEYWVLRNAQRVLFTTESERHLAEKSFFLHRWKGEVVPYGSAGPTGKPELYQQAFFELCPEVRGKRFLLFLGRIHPKKGCNMLMKAFAEVADRAPDLHLVMAGPDQSKWRIQLEAMVMDAGLTDRVHWPGMVRGDAKWGAFYACEAFVLPSHQENFGIAVAEALACGKPVLLSDKVNIAEDVANNGAALVASDTNEGTLLLLERWLALSPEQRRKMGERALACFHAHYDMSENAKAIIRLFASLTDKQRVPGPVK